MGQQSNIINSSSLKPIFFVAGATGTVGSEVVNSHGIKIHLLKPIQYSQR